MASSDSSKPLFTAELFASPSSTAGSGSGLSSLGIGDDIFQSPFSLAPAAPAATSSTSSPLPYKSTPEKVVPPVSTSSLFSRSSNVAEKTRGEDEEELSTIPLDSPSLADMGVSSEEGGNESLSVQPSTGLGFSPSLGGPTGSLRSLSGGWNDPPLLPQFSSPLRSVSQPTSLSDDAPPHSSSVPLVTGSQPALDSSNGSDLFPVQPLVAPGLQATRYVYV